MEKIKIIILSIITRLYLLFLPGFLNRIIQERILARPIDKLAEYVDKKIDKFVIKYNLDFGDMHEESNKNKILSFLKIKNDTLENSHKYFNYVINETDYFLSLKKEHKKGKI